MTPIPDHILERPANRYILMRGDHTLAEALRALQDEGGQEWWALIVDLGDGRYLAARFGDLRERIRAERPLILEIQLDALEPPLMPVEAVEQSGDLAQAEEAAMRSPMKMVVVTRGGEVVGLLNLSVSRDIQYWGEISIFELAGLIPAMPSAGTAWDSEGSRVGAGLPVPDSEGSARPTALSPMPEAPPSPAPAQSPKEEEQPALAQPPAQSDIHVEIGQNVESGGRVIVAGHDVIIGAPPEEKTQVQMRRFEAAFPQEMHVGVEEKLQIAVMLPDAPSPFGGLDKPQATAGTGDVPISMPVDRETGQLKPVDIEVSVTAAGFKVKGESKKMLTVWPDGKTAIRWFLLEPEEAGKQDVLIELSHKGRLLAEITLQATVYAPEAKPRPLLNLTLSIVSFGLSFSFSAGAAG